MLKGTAGVVCEPRLVCSTLFPQKCSTQEFTHPGTNTLKVTFLRVDENKRSFRYTIILLFHSILVESQSFVHDFPLPPPCVVVTGQPNSGYIIADVNISTGGSGHE